MLKEAAVGSRFLWMSRYSGTWLVPERDAHIRNTEAYNTWQYYADSKYYGVKAFALELKSNDGVKPSGDIYELHYKKHIEEVKKSSFSAQTVDVTFKPAHWEKGAAPTTRTFDVAEYNDSRCAIINRYGPAESIRHNLSSEDEVTLAGILDGFKMQYERESIPANVNAYVQEMVKERFHEYGYTRGDMVFTTPEDAYAAIKHRIPVYILHPGNGAEEAADREHINNAIYSGRIFGMGERDKRLLDFFAAGNILANLPFTRDELKEMLFMALDKGKENIADAKDRCTVDGVISVLDKILFAAESKDESTLEQDCEFYEGVEL